MPGTRDPPQRGANSAGIQNREEEKYARHAERLFLGAGRHAVLRHRYAPLPIPLKTIPAMGPRTHY